MIDFDNVWYVFHLQRTISYTSYIPQRFLSNGCMSPLLITFDISNWSREVQSLPPCYSPSFLAYYWSTCHVGPTSLDNMMTPLNENAFCIAGHLLGKCIGHNNNINNNSKNKNKNNWVAVDLDGMALMGRHYYMPCWRVWNVIRKIVPSDNIISTHTIYTYIYMESLAL